MPSRTLKLFTDGAARGNPGPAGIGVALLDNDGNTLGEVSETLSPTTNNVAEYSALIRGLKLAAEHEADKILIHSDSELMIKQLLGAYKVKAEHLQSYYEDARSALKRLPAYTLRHIPREQNARADALASAAAKGKPLKPNGQTGVGGRGTGVGEALRTPERVSANRKPDRSPTPVPRSPIRVYLDHAATTPLDPDVLAAMMPYLADEFGNASALYSMGQEAREAVENARSQVAALIGARADEIYFTSGATEGDNWAIFGMAAAGERKGRHLITSVIEHEAVLRPCEVLEKRGWDVTLLPVDSEGRVDPEDVKRALRPETVLISVMHSNNETGVIQPIGDIGAIARERRIPFHTDGVQSVGKVTIDVAALQCDLLSLSGHKIYGPKGVGALYVRKGVRIRPFMEGGGQEENKRSGTYNVPGIVGLGAALELAERRMESDGRTWTRWRDRIIAAALDLPDTRLNGSREHRLPHNANVSFLGTEGEPLLLGLDERGFCVSSGAACSSGSTEPSHVLTAMGLSREWAQGSLRFTVGRANTDEQVDRLLSVLPEVVANLRSLNSSSKPHKLLTTEARRR